MKYSSYAADPGATDKAPWKAGLKAQADKLLTLSDRARHRNESTWRFSCEPIVLSRLSAEVVCLSCRNRVWRSEIEARCDAVGSRRGASLRERQNAREPCRCSRSSRDQDHLEAVGLNHIFGHREDEVVRLEDNIAERLGKWIQKPDVIFGLRQTRNIENLLHDTPNWQKQQPSETNPQQLHEILQPWPVDESGDKLLYPFLVLEAKSGTSRGDWHSIQMQTAFPIRAFLETQNRLRTEAGSLDESQSAPLVWFFASRGEDWRVSVAYMTKGKPRSNTVGDTDYVVMDVWSGSIVDPDGALQLLLLVDYVFDWARDVYRRNILGNLRLLASGDNDAASVSQWDSAMLSIWHVDPTHMFHSTTGNDDYQAYVSAQRAFVVRDSESCIIRHATFVESRYCCVFVTRDNVGAMLQSTDSSKTGKLLRLILNLMSEAMQLEESSIDAMEEQWTGTSRMNPTKAFAPKAQFHTIVSCMNYLTASWHQVRELYVVAIADDAWDAVVEASEFIPNRRTTRRPRKRARVDLEDLLQNLDRLQAGTPGDTLLTCISRRAMTLRLDSNDTGPKTAKPSAASTDGDAMPGKVRLVISEGVLRDVVHSIYTWFKKGSIEPQEFFLRFSTRHSQQHLFSDDKLPVFPPGTHAGTLQASKDGCVLVYGECNTRDRRRSPSTVCLYLVDGDPVAPTEQDTARITKHTFETRDVHHTTRDNGTSNISNLNARKRKKEVQNKPVPWNIENTYGIYSGMCDGTNGPNHPILRRCGTSTLPDRQGSPRLSDRTMSGGYLHKRVIVPWSDPRLVDNYPTVRMFFIFKLMSGEIRYWKKVAAARRAEGYVACHYCASVLGDFDPPDPNYTIICGECDDEVEEHKGDWLSNCFEGVTPFPAEEGGNYGEHGDGDGVYNVSSGFEGVSSNEKWKAGIGGYPKLKRPFKDMVELLALCEIFRKWDYEREFGRLGNDFGPSRKRLRLEDWSGRNSSAGDDSKYQPADDGSEYQPAEDDSESQAGDDVSNSKAADGDSGFSPDVESDAEHM